MFFHVLRVRRLTQVALCAIQYTFVSLAIPVRMEQHVISVLATLTTPAHVLPTTQDRLVIVSINLLLQMVQHFRGNHFSECVLSCPLGQEANSACECVPVHTCLTNNPCQNGATCNIGANSNTDYTCSCPPDYTGQNCDSKSIQMIKVVVL